MFLDLELNIQSCTVSKVESDDAHSEVSDTVPVSSASVQLPSVVVPPPKSSRPLQAEDLETSLQSPSDQSHDYEDANHAPLVGVPEAARLETQMDAWCLDLKRNVLVCQLKHQRSTVCPDTLVSSIACNFY